VSTTFEPIAIVGRGLVLPGATARADFARSVLAGEDHVRPVSAARWGIDPALVATTKGSLLDGSVSRMGSVVDESLPLDLDGLVIDRAFFARLDPIFSWVAHAARHALADSGLPVVDDARADRIGIFLGNLSFPTEGMARFGARALAESVFPAFAESDFATLLGLPRGEPLDRFMSGLPAHVAARALGLTGGALTLDAACASSLYALALASMKLQRGVLDVALAGAVNRADNLFLHVGFTALSALSATGQSRPFHKDADGLVPGEGCGVVALMRLRDARKRGMRVHGIIRGIGLSNDGRARNLLAPSDEGQARAIRAAWSSSGLDPTSIGYVECHATGTPMGDKTELASMRMVFGDARAQSIPVGSLKSNLGHLITAAGVAGLEKVLIAFEHAEIPQTLHADVLTDPLRDETSPFRLVREREPFAPTHDGLRRAAVSAFGFGGNNAHLIVDEPADGRDPAPVMPIRTSPPRVVIAGLALRAGDFEDDGVLNALREGATVRTSTNVSFAWKGVRFPPQDLKDALPQQLMILELARRVVDGVPAAALPRDRTGVFIGMQCDADVTTPGLRWRLAEHARTLAIDSTVLNSWKDAFCAPVSAQRVLGQMPNIPANRLNVQLDLAGMGFTLSAEELSGIAALDVARTLLEDGALDAAVVGAVDMSGDVRDRRALHALSARACDVADQGIALLAMREDDARKHGLPVLAIVDDVLMASGGQKPARDMADIDLHVALDDATGIFGSHLGHAHAASGLVACGVSVLALSRGLDVRSSTKTAPETASIAVRALGGANGIVRLRAGDRVSATMSAPFAPEDLMTVSARRHVGTMLAPNASHATMPIAPPVPLAAPMTARDLADVTRPPAGDGPQTMPPAPVLPVLAHRERLVVDAQGRGFAPHSSTRAPEVPTPATQNVHLSMESTSSAPLVDERVAFGDGDESGLANALAATRRLLTSAHEGFIAEATRAHHAFLASRHAATEAAAVLAPTHRERSPPFTFPATADTPRMARVVPSHGEPARAETPLEAKPSLASERTVRGGSEPSSSRATEADWKCIDFTFPEGKNRLLRLRATPWLDRQALEKAASHPISTVLGPVFSVQDEFRRVVRMPEPPLLLCDRVLSSDVTLGKLETDRTIVTESDVTWDKWYVENGRVPAGILIESGQADLLLVSAMGVDKDNRGERVYRLLGCDLTYAEHLPAVGAVLHYDIHVDGFANHGKTRIFFFHSDCREGGPEGPIVLSVRNGQAGFFSDEELLESGGILWKPSDVKEGELKGPLDAPLVTPPSSIDGDALRTLAKGDVERALGPQYMRAASHVRTPTLPDGRMLLLDRVTTLDPQGGPWGRGYLRAELDLTGENWFFDGHFKNDPCMPGTIMFEGCLQCLDVYLVALGFTLEKDGWRFEPTKDEAFKLRCRGQAVPSSRSLVYEVFVREIEGGAHPRVIADILVTVDGLKALHCERTGVELVVDWPMSSHPELTGNTEKTSGFDAVGGVVRAGDTPLPSVFDQRALLATGWGRPSEAFAIYAPFDDGTRVARLPGPPYHFMSRVRSLDGPPEGAFKPGNTVVVDYDVPRDAWFFDAHPSRVMPYSVLLEVALQPCGWLSSYTGSVLQVQEPLYYRNLDGKGAVRRHVSRDVGTVSTKATMTSSSMSAGMIIQSFTFEVSDADGIIFDGSTVFGFFPKGALERQVGLGATDEERAALTAPSSSDVGRYPLELKQGLDAQMRAQFPNDMLLMIDRIVSFSTTGGKYGQGRIVAEKDVDPHEWFFKAHFFQDPVQPGSLGIQAMLDTITFAASERGVVGPTTVVAPIATGLPLTWKYRGQVVPRNKTVSIVCDLVEVTRERVVAEAFLWVDGLRIYHAERIGIEVSPVRAPTS
jgi:3-oxoacyl-(acyl-carrier-protein) synthase/3-hydroxymyristoyl/3-hydroxydecanoyl-(acyl carrier protein) dehydratase